MLKADGRGAMSGKSNCARSTAKSSSSASEHPGLEIVAKSLLVAR